MSFFIAHLTSLKISSFGSSFACQHKPATSLRVDEIGTNQQIPSAWIRGKEQQTPKKHLPKIASMGPLYYLPIHENLPKTQSFMDRYIYIRPRPMDPSWVLLWLILVGRGCNWMKGWICFLITGVTLSKTERKPTDLKVTNPMGSM